MRHLPKIKPWKPLQKKAISENIELSEEDIQQAKQQTIAKVVVEKEKLVAKAAKKKTETELNKLIC
jgi:hypothetical protein